MSDYAWTITKDHLADDEGDQHAIGPHDCTLSARQIRETPGAEKFRMLDDDGELYYEGYICGEYDGFEPLDDFGMPNAGATEIQYRNQDGEWKGL